MISTRLARVAVASGADVSRVRRSVARHAEAMGFSLLDRTRLVTAASELARNMLSYGGGGEARLDEVVRETGTSLRISFDDTGPGIDDLEAAQRDGFSTGQGLGLGLGGARRLVDDFLIESTPGVGTRIAIERHLPTGRTEP